MTYDCDATLSLIHKSLAFCQASLQSASRSVGVVGDVGAGGVARATLVGALSSGAIGLGSLKKGSLGSSNVLGLTLPCLQH